MSSEDREPAPEEEGADQPLPEDSVEPAGGAASARGSIGPYRLHVAAMIISSLRSARQWASLAAIPGIAALFSGGLGPVTLLLVILGAVVLAAVAVVWGFLSWRATTYSVSGGAFYLRRGVLQKSERTIPLEHVQSVDTVQGVVQRVFGVVELRVETAGGGAEESDASLPALSRASATELRRAVEGGGAEPTEGGGDGPREIRRLDTRSLLIAGATSGQIGIALSLVAVGSQLFDEFFTEGFLRRLYETLAPGSVVALVAVALAVGLFAWLLAIAGTVLSYSGFTLSRDEEFLYIRRGLLEKREATIPLARIQAVQVVEGVLRQPFGLAMLRVESAGYGGSESGVSTTLFPLIPRRGVLEFLREATPEFAEEVPQLSNLRRPPRRARRRYLFRAIAPVILPLAAVFASFYVSGLSLPAWAYPAAGLLLALAGLLGWVRYRDAGWAHYGDRLVLRSRTLARTTAFAPRRRLQSRSAVSNPLQRRSGLAHLRVKVASGSGGAEFGVQDMEAGDVQRIIARLGPGRG